MEIIEITVHLVALESLVGRQFPLKAGRVDDGEARFLQHGGIFRPFPRLDDVQEAVEQRPGFDPRAASARREARQCARPTPSGTTNGWDGPGWSTKPALS
jgi:hypothetical protein